MKYYLLTGSLIVIIVAVIALFFIRPATNAPVSTTSNGVGFPIAGMNATSSISVGSTSTITVASKNGTGMAVNDFIHNGDTAPDTSNSGQYYLTGTPMSTSTSDFIIKYTESGQSFIIALTKEPLGQARQDAEQFLMKTLGISQAQMCALNYYLGTDVYTSSFYGGKNLGFSFCPGATELPQ